MTTQTKSRIYALAAEESSIYDVLIEIRQDYCRDHSFEGMMSSFKETMIDLHELYDAGYISFYNAEDPDIDIRVAERNIYASFLRVRSPRPSAKLA